MINEIDKELMERILAKIRAEYTVMPRFGYHQPLDYSEVTLPPGFLPALSHPSTDLPVPGGADRFGYSPDDLEKYLSWGALDHRLLTAVIDKHCRKRNGRDNDFALLDFGCSSGRVLRHFQADYLEKGWRLHGCDIQAKAIQWQRQHFPNHFNVINSSTLPHLPFEDNTFDFIYGISVFTHIKYQWDAWLMELRRVMKKGGVMVQTIHTENAWKYYSGHKEEQWIQNSLPPRVYDVPEMDVDFLYSGNIGVSQVFWKQGVAREYFGRYFEVVDLLAPPEMSFQDWVIMRKD